MSGIKSVFGDKSRQESVWPGMGRDECVGEDEDGQAGRVGAWWHESDWAGTRLGRSGRERVGRGE